MEAKFTKGPWQINNDRDFEECTVFAERSDEIVDICEVSTCVTVSNEDNCIDESQIEANANLIAAAPDLYEALDTTCEYCIGKEATDCPCERCVTGKALRKARGEE